MREIRVSLARDMKNEVRRRNEKQESFITGVITGAIMVVVITALIVTAQTIIERGRQNCIIKGNDPISCNAWVK